MLPDDLRTQPLLSFWTAGTRFRNPCGADVHPAASEGNGVLAAADTLSDFRSPVRCAAARTAMRVNPSAALKLPARA